MWTWFTSKIALIGAGVLAVLGVLAVAFGKGKADQKQKQQVQDAKDLQNAVEIRNNAQQTNAQLPDPGTVKVGDAPANSAAGKLRDQWSRD